MTSGHHSSTMKVFDNISSVRLHKLMSAKGVAKTTNQATNKHCGQLTVSPFTPLIYHIQTMKSTFQLITALLCMSFLVGCASNQQFVHFPDQSKVVEDPSKGRIYVMRPASIGGAISMDVSDDGRIVGSTGPSSYLCWERPPGNTVISAKSENTSAVGVDVEAGKVNYIFLHVRMGWVMARNKLEIVSEEEGKKVLKECDPPKVIK